MPVCSKNLNRKKLKFLFTFEKKNMHILWNYSAYNIYCQAQNEQMIRASKFEYGRLEEALHEMSSLC